MSSESHKKDPKSRGNKAADKTKIDRSVKRLKAHGSDDLQEWIAAQVGALQRELHVMSDRFISSSREFRRREVALAKLKEFAKSPSSDSRLLPQNARFKLNLNPSAGIKDDSTVISLIADFEEEKEAFLKKVGERFESLFQKEKTHAASVRATELITRLHRTFVILVDKLVTVDRITTPTTTDMDRLGTLALLRFLQNEEHLDDSFFEFLDTDRKAFGLRVSKQLVQQQKETEKAADEPITQEDGLEDIVNDDNLKICTKAGETAKVFVQSLTRDLFLDVEETKRKREAEKDLEARYAATSITEVTQSTAEALEDDPKLSHAQFEQLIDEKFEAQQQKLLKKFRQETRKNISGSGKPKQKQQQQSASTKPARDTENGDKPKRTSFASKKRSKQQRQTDKDGTPTTTTQRKEKTKQRKRKDHRDGSNNDGRKEKKRVRIVTPGKNAAN